MNSSTPIIVTHPCSLFHSGLRQLFAKLRFRPIRIESTLSDELENYLRSLENCIWLVGVERCVPPTNSLVRRVVAANPGVKAVIFAACQTPKDIIPALEAGASGFLCQDIAAEQCIQALELIVLGQVVVHRQFAWGQMAAAGPIQGIGETQGNGAVQTSNNGSYLSQPSDSPLVATESSSETCAGDVVRNLSNREKRILQLLVEGASNKVIARRLVITESTVKVHMKAVLRKLRLRNRTQAAIWARDHIGETSESAGPAFI